MAPGSLRPEAPESPEPARTQCSGGDGGSPECAWRCSGMSTGRGAMETVHRPAWCRQTPSAGLEPSPAVAPGFLRVTGRFSTCCLLRRVKALRPASDCLQVAGTEVRRLLSRSVLPRSVSEKGVDGTETHHLCSLPPPTAVSQPELK